MFITIVFPNWSSRRFAQLMPCVLIQWVHITVTAKRVSRNRETKIGCVSMWMNAMSSQDYAIRSASISGDHTDVPVTLDSNWMRIIAPAMTLTNARSTNHTTCVWASARIHRDHMPVLVHQGIVWAPMDGLARVRHTNSSSLIGESQLTDCIFRYWWVWLPL